MKKSLKNFKLNHTKRIWVVQEAEKKTIWTKRNYEAISVSWCYTQKPKRMLWDDKVENKRENENIENGGEVDNRDEN